MALSREQAIFILIGITSCLWALTEILSPVIDPISFIRSFLLLVSSVGLLLRLRWALTMFFVIAVWYIVQNVLFIAFASFLPLRTEQIALLPLVIAVRSMQTIFYIFSIFFIRFLLRKGFQYEKTKK